MQEPGLETAIWIVRPDYIEPIDYRLRDAILSDIPGGDDFCEAKRSFTFYTVIFRERWLHIGVDKQNSQPHVRHECAKICCQCRLADPALRTQYSELDHIPPRFNEGHGHNQSECC